MILKVNDASDFNISMDLNIYYDREYIDLAVKTWDKTNNTMQMKRFSANDFSQALAYYNQQEKMFNKEN